MGSAHVDPRDAPMPTHPEGCCAGGGACGLQGQAEGVRSSSARPGANLPTLSSRKSWWAFAVLVEIAALASTPANNQRFAYVTRAPIAPRPEMPPDGVDRSWRLRPAVARSLAPKQTGESSALGISESHAPARHRNFMKSCGAPPDGNNRRDILNAQTSQFASRARTRRPTLLLRTHTDEDRTSREWIKIRVRPPVRIAENSVATARIRGWSIRDRCERRRLPWLLHRWRRPRTSPGSGWHSRET